MMTKEKETVVYQTLIGVCKRGDYKSAVYWVNRSKNNLDFISNDFENPLLSAVINNHEDIVKLLIENGANPNLEIEGHTILGWTMIRNNFCMARILTSLGAQLDLDRTEHRESLRGLFETSHFSKDMMLFLKEHHISFSNLI